MSRVAVLKGGRSLERQVSLRSGARVEDALERLGHDVVAIDVGARPRRAPARARARTSRSSRCTAATARTAPCRSCSSCSASPTPARASSACIRCWDKVLAKHAAARRRASRRPTSTPSARRPSSELGAARGAAGDRGARSSSRSSSSRPRRARRWASSSPRSAADVPAALVAAFSYDRKVLLERHVDGRDLAVSIVDEDGDRALPVVEAVPARGGLLRLRGALRDRPHARSSARRSSREATRRARRSWRSTSTGCSAAPASRGST